MTPIFRCCPARGFRAPTGRMPVRKSPGRICRARARLYACKLIHLKKGAARICCGDMRKIRVLNDDALELIARRFAALAEPMRLKLVHALFSGDKNVNTLVEETGGTQANVSRHLQTLTNAHVLARRKEGLQVFYSISDPTIYKLCDLVCGSIEKQLTRQAGAFGGGPES